MLSAVSELPVKKCIKFAKVKVQMIPPGNEIMIRNNKVNHKKNAHDKIASNNFFALPETQ